MSKEMKKLWSVGWIIVMIVLLSADIVLSRNWGHVLAVWVLAGLLGFALEMDRVEIGLSPVALIKYVLKRRQVVFYSCIAGIWLLAIDVCHRIVGGHQTWR